MIRSHGVGIRRTGQFGVLSFSRIVGALSGNRNLRPLRVRHGYGPSAQSVIGASQAVLPGNGADDGIRNRSRRADNAPPFPDGPIGNTDKGYCSQTNQSGFRARIQSL